MCKESGEEKFLTDLSGERNKIADAGFPTNDFCLVSQFVRVSTCSQNAATGTPRS